jgi:hypothetical protein
MIPDQQDQRGLFGADNTAEATHQLHEGTRAMATRYDTSIILGWQDKVNSRRAYISLTMFVDGFESTDEDGVVSIYSGCGLGEAAVRAACRSLCALRFLVKVGTPTEKGQEWQLGESPDWAALEKRTAEQAAKRKQQVEKAIAAGAAKRSGVTLDDTGVTLNDTPLTSDDTPQVTLNDGSGVTSNDRQQSHVQSQDQNHNSGRPRNSMFDAVSWAWLNTNGGYVGKLIKFLTGKCVKKDGLYFQFQIDPAMTPREIVGFKLWRDNLERDMPSIPETINRLVLEFRGVPEYQRVLEQADLVLATLGRPVIAKTITGPSPAISDEPLEIHDTDAILDALAEKLGA